MRPARQFLTSLFAAAVFTFVAPDPAPAAEKCKGVTCSSSSATKTADGWNVNIKIRLNKVTSYEFYNVLLYGHPQMEVDGPGNVVELNLAVPDGWDGKYGVQPCISNRPNPSVCEPWLTFKTELRTMPALTTPDAKFCNWYASDAVARVPQGTKCGFSGDQWDPNRQAHYDWCMGLQAQQEAWGEHNARLGALADCAKKEVANAPPKANQSAGAPDVIVKQDVDIYKDPGGAGQPFDILRTGSKVGVYERRADQWCLVAGKAVPGGGGWVWCGKGFELN